jgi:ABC-type nitrate/sulfonate/bicarbonate transport system substrate-binding protein
MSVLDAGSLGAGRMATGRACANLSSGAAATAASIRGRAGTDAGRRISSSRQEGFMRMLRAPLVAAAAMGLASIFAASANAQATKVTIGKVIGGDGFHVPTYIAMDKGYFKQEGLDVSFIEMNAKAQVNAVLSGNLDCAPIPSGGAQAALSGAPIEYIVGESLKSQWTLTTSNEIKTVADIKGKTLGLGRPGSADYDEVPAVLSRFFNIQLDKDYKVISFQGEPDRIAALLNGQIQGAALSIPHAAQAIATGELKILFRTGDYIPRAGGTIWCMKSFVEKNPETVKKIIRAIAKAVTYFRTNKDGSIPVLKKELGIKTDKEAGIIWDQLHDSYGAEVPKDLFRAIFASRRLTMVAARQWSKDKPLPDPEQFLARKLLDSTLQQMGYVPTKTAPPGAK